MRRTTIIQKTGGSGASSSLGNYTWANRPSVSTNAGKSFFCTDIANGIMLVSDGNVWRSPSNGRIMLLSGGINIGIPSSGTMGNNGALSGITALQVTYSEGLYLYFPANAIFAGSTAGLYWTVMSSATAGTVYNNTYNGGQIYEPTSLTPFVSTGPGAYTQVLTEITLGSATMPASFLGKNGLIECETTEAHNNSAGVKTLKHKLDTTIIVTTGFTTSQSGRIMSRISNCNSLAAQIRISETSGIAAAPSNTGSSITFSKSTVDTSVNKTYAITGQLSAATDYLVLASYSIMGTPR